MTDREVVITGTGLTSPLGKNVDENWANIKGRKSGIGHYPVEGLPDFMQYMGKVIHHDLPEDIPPKQRGQMKFLNRGAILGFSSVYEALAGVTEYISDFDPGRRALYVASGDFTQVGSEFMYPAIKDVRDQSFDSLDYEKLNRAMLDKVNPFFLLESLHNNLFSFLSAYAEFMGPSTSIASLSPCGSNAVELAYRSIKQDNADIALAVGYGSWISEIPLYELEGLGILSDCRSGTSSFRPFDRKRNGFIPGEGGATIVLEAAEVARARGSKIIGKIKGTSNCIEFTGNNQITVPDRVSKRNMEDLIEDAGCQKDDISFLIPHGSGTKKGDSSELRSIIDLFGGDSAEMPICGLKPYTGHMGAASDIAEIVIGIKALENKTVPATLNFRETEKEFSELKISDSPQTSNKDLFLSTSYGVGGQSSSVIIEA